MSDKPLRAPVGFPPAAAARWVAVVEAAGRRCECAGECGRSHAKSEGRCPVEHLAYASHHGARPLVVAPVTPGAALPAGFVPDEPRAWCPSCLDAVMRAARRVALAASAAALDADSPTLFDL